MTMVEVESRLAALESEVATLRQRVEQAQSSAAMRRSIKQIEQGEGVPALEAVKALGRKYGITRA
jgi:phage shock protein A